MHFWDGLSILDYVLLESQKESSTFFRMLSPNDPTFLTTCKPMTQMILIFVIHQKTVTSPLCHLKTSNINFSVIFIHSVIIYSSSLPKKEFYKYFHQNICNWSHFVTKRPVLQAFHLTPTHTHCMSPLLTYANRPAQLYSLDRVDKV